MEGTTSVNTNVWIHVVATKSTGSTTADFALYINGIAETVSLLSGANHTGSTVGAAQFALAARDGAGQYWNGSLAEAGMWDIVLTEQQAKSLAKGMKCSRVMPQNLKFYAPLVRNGVSLQNGTLTVNNGPTVANHPRVY